MNDYQSHVPRSTVSHSIASLRLATGLLQGFILYLLYHAVENKVWTPGNSWLFDILLLVVGLVPVFLIIGLGHMSAKSLWRWLIPATIVLALLGYYDWWRSMGAPDWRRYDAANGARYPSGELLIHVLAGFFIAKSLVLASTMDRKRIASYRSYFECSWKLLIQIVFAVVFTGIFWLVLWLGASLFQMIKLDFLKHLLEKSWFAIPITTFAFSYALHITDVRPGIVSGIRSLLLVLLSWILPVAVLLIGGFLLALPFTGLEPLWATKQATALLLVASALLVILINAAFQDGSVAKEVAKLIKLSALTASFCLVPLVAIAAYALSMRVGQYGWTTDRLVAAFCIVIAACYAFGYLWATLKSPEWISKVASVNVATAFVALFLLFAIFSPLLDPARISVTSQIAHLNGGKISADKFDYNYLRFEGMRFGNAALKEMAARKSGKDASVISLKAKAALDKKYSREPVVAPDKINMAVNITVWPKGSVLPTSFINQDWKKNTDWWPLPVCLSDRSATCDAFLIDVDNDGRNELLFPSAYNGIVLGLNKNGKWYRVGVIDKLSSCSKAVQELKNGTYQLVPSMIKDILIGDTRYRIDSVEREGAKVSVDCSQ
jgi:hypothetical protein